MLLIKQEVGPGSESWCRVLTSAKTDLTDCLGLLASKAIGPTAARGQLYGIAAAVGKGLSPISPTAPVVRSLTEQSELSSELTPSQTSSKV
jgi:hypothetical protein